MATNAGVQAPQRVATGGPRDNNLCVAEAEDTVVTSPTSIAAKDSGVAAFTTTGVDAQPAEPTPDRAAGMQAGDERVANGLPVARTGAVMKRQLSRANGDEGQPKRIKQEQVVVAPPTHTQTAPAVVEPGGEQGAAAHDGVAASTGGASDVRAATIPVRTLGYLQRAAARKRRAAPSTGVPLGASLHNAAPVVADDEMWAAIEQQLGEVCNPVARDAGKGLSAAAASALYAGAGVHPFSNLARNAARMTTMEDACTLNPGSRAGGSVVAANAPVINNGATQTGASAATPAEMERRMLQLEQELERVTRERDAAVRMAAHMHAQMQQGSHVLSFLDFLGGGA